MASPEKSLILSYDDVIATERYMLIYINLILYKINTTEIKKEFINTWYYYVMFEVHLRPVWRTNKPSIVSEVRLISLIYYYPTTACNHTHKVGMV